mmetsp:Transcript_29776/g.58987  ORF Transcript_29776/g.58987 Transcript_29776/m.58987 type:complete len:80 (-) Transcript_29776:39-278(-)
MCPHQEEMQDYKARSERELNVFFKYQGVFARNAGATTWDTAAHPKQFVCKEHLTDLLEMATAWSFAECAELAEDRKGNF